MNDHTSSPATLGPLDALRLTPLPPWPPSRARLRMAARQAAESTGADRPWFATRQTLSRPWFAAPLALAQAWLAARLSLLRSWLAAQPRVARSWLASLRARPWSAVRMPPWAWLALHAAALWPHGVWAARRLADGSDDPLGLAAAAALLLVLLRHAPRLRERARGGWLGVSLALTAAATAALGRLPPLVGALLAALALAAAVASRLPTGVARLPLVGLTLLAVPLVASMQFYLGYPLRLVTAQASTWLLQALGFAAERSGTAMSVAGQLVIVDAPCSGVQMAWLGYFCACTAAAFAGTRDGVLMKRLPLVAMLVLGGNVVRNAWLVALQARPQGLEPWAHQAIGLAVLACVCAAVVRVVTRKPRAAETQAAQAATAVADPMQRQPRSPWRPSHAAAL